MAQHVPDVLVGVQRPDRRLTDETLQVDEAAMRRNLERSAIPAGERAAGFGAAPAMIERVLEEWRAIARGTSP